MNECVQTATKLYLIAMCRNKIACEKESFVVSTIRQTAKFIRLFSQNIESIYEFVGKKAFTLAV